VTFVAFIASIPAIKGRYDQYFEKVTTGIDAAKKRVDPAIDNLEQQATCLVALARSKLDGFVVSIKNELRQVSRSKAAIEALSAGSIEIPNVSDLDGYLDKKECSIRGSMNEARSAARLDKFIPWVLKTHGNFRVGVVLPILFGMLAIQLLGTWWTERALEPTDNKWDPVIVSSQTFLIAVAEISFSFFVTRAERIVGYVNRKIRGMNGRVNVFLKNKAGEAFHSVLDLAMNHVRVRVLEVVNRLRRIERFVVGVQGKAHELENMAGQATETIILMESTIHGMACIESHQASSLMQSITRFLSTLVQKIDDSTAGLVDCTGFTKNNDHQ
jgi:hypothetical protein